MRFAAFVVTLAALWAAALPAQEQLTVNGPSPKMVPLGSTTTIQFKVAGAGAAPGKLELPAVEGLTYRYGGPSTQSFFSFDGARRRREFSVTWQVQIRPSRLGTYTIPAMGWNTGTREQQIGPFEFEVVEDVRGEHLAYVEMGVRPERVYVHEPIRVAVDYGVDKSVNLGRGRAGGGQQYYDIDLSAPWLDELDGAVQLDLKDKPARTIDLPINNERLESVQFLESVRRDRREFHPFRLQRLFLPTRPGTLQLTAPILRFSQETGPQRRDIFGGRVAGKTDQFFAYGKPMSVVVLPLPEEGRPDDFTGAVGRFRLDARVDRTKVKVGDSVKLRLVVSGEGNIEFLGLPEPGEIEGFHELGRNENRSDARAELIVDITPVDESATEVPSIAWSYFDTTPGVERYVDVRTEPIRLEVEPLPEGAGLSTLPGQDAKAVVPGVDDIFDITTLDELRVSEPPAVERSPDLWVRVASFLVPWLLVLGASWFATRRRASIADVSGRRAKGARRAFDGALSAGESADTALTDYLAARLGVASAAVIGPDLGARLDSAGVEPQLGEELVRAVEQGTAARYGGGAGLSQEAARGLVDRCELAAIRRIGTAVLAFCLLVGGVKGQPELERAQASYRGGAYAEAAEQYRRAAESDRRLFYNAGNALFREGRLAEAVVAWERARLAMPRDERLAANIALAQQRLDVARDVGGQPFVQAVLDLRDSFTTGERIVICLLVNGLAAALLVFGRRSLRWIGGAMAIPSLLLILDVTTMAEPNVAAIVVRGGELVAEPRDGLEAVMTARPGVRVEVLGRGDDWTRVQMGGRDGWMKTGNLGFIE